MFEIGLIFLSEKCLANSDRNPFPRTNGNKSCISSFTEPCSTSSSSYSAMSRPPSSTTSERGIFTDPMCHGSDGRNSTCNLIPASNEWLQKKNMVVFARECKRSSKLNQFGVRTFSTGKCGSRSASSDYGSTSPLARSPSSHP